MTAVMAEAGIHLEAGPRSLLDRTVAVIGLGRSGVSAAQLLCRLGAQVRVTEARDTESLRATRASLLSEGAQSVELGRHSPDLLQDAELLVVSPGVPESIGPMQWAREHGLPIVSEIELAFCACPSPIIAVTGTNGKSTAVTLISEILRAAGRRAVACGNLGIPFSSVISELTPDMIAVVEVSSFQLLGCERFRPHIGVLLNIGANHLDRHADVPAYRAAKARLFQRQTDADWAVLNGRDPAVMEISEQVRARRVWFGENRSNSAAWRLAPETQRALADNAQAVLQVARLMGVPDPLTWQVMRSFRGLEHRLEYVASLRGVHMINDSKSTTPDSTLYALSQVGGELVVMLGGRDKGLDFSPLARSLRDPRVKGVVLMGEARPKLRAALQGIAARECRTLADAVQAACRLASPGMTVLLSPACASFDQFQDFEARGRAFKAIIAEMEGVHR